MAIALSNSSPFALSAGICTRLLLHAGSGASSYGPREQGRAARTFYTTSKTIYQRAL